jgi:sterol 3beta-glucosyltransferase
MPTGAWTPPLPDRNRNFGRLINRLAWRGLAHGSGMAMYDRVFNRYRRELGLDKITGAALLSWTAAQRTVVMVSRHYFGDAPEDWAQWPLTGFSAWSGPTALHVDERVEHFLDDGDPPVLVCLGTSAAAGAGHTFNEIATGLAQRGLRSLLLVGSSADLAQLDHVPGAFEFAPVPAVAGRCSAAVVSGALGTLAASLTAGIPVVVVPQLFDQVWHGRRVEALGVGIMVTNPAKVADAVARLHNDPSYSYRAKELGTRLRTEDGAAALVDAVQTTL